MADPITWRNINAPSFGGVSQGVNSGAALLTSGIRGLAGQAANVGSQAVAREDQVQSDLVDNFKAQLVGAKTEADVDNVLSSLEGAGLTDANLASTISSGQSRQQDIHQFDRTLENERRADVNFARSEDVFQEGQVNKDQALFADNLISTFQDSTEANVQKAVGKFAKANGLTMENGDIVGPLTPQQQLGMANVLAPVRQANQLKEFDKQLEAAGLDNTERRGHLDTFEETMNRRNELPKQAQRDLDSQITQASNQVDLLYSQAVSDHQKLVRELPYSEEELLRQQSVDEASVRNLALEKAPDGSILDAFSDRKGGAELQKSITSIMSNQYIIVPAREFMKDRVNPLTGKVHGQDKQVFPETIRKATAAEINNPNITKHKPEWHMMETALLASTQTDEDAFGDPTTDTDTLEQMVMNQATNVQEKRARNAVDRSRTQLQELEFNKNSAKLKNASDLSKQAKVRAGVGSSPLNAIIAQFSTR